MYVYIHTYIHTHIHTYISLRFLKDRFAPNRQRVWLYNLAIECVIAIYNTLHPSLQTFLFRLSIEHLGLTLWKLLNIDRRFFVTVGRTRIMITNRIGLMACLKANSVMAPIINKLFLSRTKAWCVGMLGWKVYHHNRLG